VFTVFSIKTVCQSSTSACAVLSLIPIKNALQQCRHLFQTHQVDVLPGTLQGKTSRHQSQDRNWRDPSLHCVLNHISPEQCMPRGVCGANKTTLADQSMFSDFMGISCTLGLFNEECRGTFFSCFPIEKYVDNNKDVDKAKRIDNDKGLHYFPHLPSSMSA
jgi:hypothetical protein